MVNYRYVRVMNTMPTLGDTGTALVQLGTSGAINRMLLSFRATNSAGGNLTNPISACIKSIRILTGTGKAQMSMSATDLIACNQLISGILPNSSEVDTANAVQISRIPVVFSRSKTDSGIGLDLARVQGATLEITFDIALVRATGNLGFVANSLTIDVDLYKSLPGESTNLTACIIPVLVIPGTATVVDTVRFDRLLAVPMVSMLLYVYKSGSADGVVVSDCDLRNMKTEAPLASSIFTALQNVDPLLDGSVLTSWAKVVVMPGRFEEVPIQTFNGGEAKLSIKELVAAGQIKVVAEALMAL